MVRSYNSHSELEQNRKVSNEELSYSMQKRVRKMVNKHKRQSRQEGRNKVNSILFDRQIVTCWNNNIAIIAMDTKF